MVARVLIILKRNKARVFSRILGTFKTHTHGIGKFSNVLLKIWGKNALLYFALIQYMQRITV
jgi:hypothetical protein